MSKMMSDEERACELGGVPIVCKEHGNSELRILREECETLRKGLLAFCNDHSCQSCAFRPLIPDDVNMLPDACPLRVHSRELLKALNTVTETEGVQMSKKEEHLYRVHWLEDQKQFIKGFDMDLKCREMQYEVNKTFTMPEGAVPRLCCKGLHYCANWLEVFDYYPVTYSRYCEVTVPEDALTDGADNITTTKRCSDKIHIEEEITVSELIRGILDTRGFRYSIKEWASYDTMTVQESYSLVSVKAMVGVIAGGYSAMCLRVSSYGSGVVIAGAPNSAAFMDADEEHALAVATRDNSVACTQANKCVAVALSFRTLAMTDGHGSVAVAAYSESQAIVTKPYSVAVSVTDYTARVRLEGDFCIGVSGGYTEVTGRRCTVIIPYCVNRRNTTLKAVTGTVVIILDHYGDPLITEVGPGKAIEPDIIFSLDVIFHRLEVYK